MEAYLAHIAPDGREQTVLEHLTGTAELAEKFGASFGGEEQTRLAGLAHDIGKYSLAFQRRLRGGPPADHATAGAYECFRLGQPCAAFAVAGHHGGLPDGGGKGDSEEAPTFFGRMNRAAKGELPPYNAWHEEGNLPSPPRPAMTDRTELMFFTRMLYSCLVDADFLDTEAFMEGRPRAGGAVSMENLWERLQKHISGWFPPEGELNRQRCAILERCMTEGGQRTPGLFTLTVPTGGGKTAASLAFALAHAKAHGLRRVIYVIPYTSIIEQTSETFREILGEETVLEHHSNALYNIEDEARPEMIRLMQATENWDMPVIVTTAVQFFESLYACRSSQCRKLHNVAGSVVVFDEAQMLPLSYLRPCVHAISQLVKHYHVSALLCTATQPALEPLFREFLPNCCPAEICPPGTFRQDVFRRVTFRKAGRMTWDKLAEHLNRQRQVLCIVNSRKSARAVFSRLEGDGCFHLSTLMYPAHRQAQLKEIRARLDDGRPCRVVSTSLIEAGVDVDFPAIYREEAGLDSVLQAAGRCNREGRLPAESSIVTVFQGEDKPPKLFSTSIEVGRMVMERHQNISSPQAIHEYFHELLEVKGRKAQDIQEILPSIRSELFPFRKVAETFHLIDTPTRTVYIPLGEGAALAERLRAGERNRSLFRALGRYGVSVYENHFQALDRSGSLELLEDGSAILTDLALYDNKTGLSSEADTGRALFV